MSAKVSSLDLKKRIISLSVYEMIPSREGNKSVFFFRDIAICNNNFDNVFEIATLKY